MTVALVVVDVQNDFTESGPFSLTGNDAIARRIGAFVASHRHLYDLVITTQDWHIEPGEHFVKHPVHCVAGTPGAALDPELDVGAGATFTDLVDLQLYKGQYGDDYSGFAAAAPDGEGAALPALLQRAGRRPDRRLWLRRGRVRRRHRSRRPDGRLPGEAGQRSVGSKQSGQWGPGGVGARRRRSRDHAVRPGRLAGHWRASQPGAPGASATVRL